jgi:xylulokinase
MATLLLGIDIGTYSSKGVLCRPDGAILAEAHADHEMSIPKPGYAEHDADGVWWADFVTISQASPPKCRPETGSPRWPRAIGACLLPVDKQGKPLRPGILYGVDIRAATRSTSSSSNTGARHWSNWAVCA